MQATSIDYQGKDSGPGLSRSLWAKFDEMQRDKFSFWMQDFYRMPTFASATDQDGYVTYQDAGCTIGNVASNNCGVLRILCDATGSDEEAAITWGDSAQAGAIISTAGSEKAMWFEARVRLSSVAAISAMVGMGEENLPANSLLADAGTGYDADFVGFRILEADPDGWDAVHMTNSGSETVVANAAQVAVAATWYKLGFRYYKNSDSNWKCEYFVDGVSKGEANATDSGFPDGEYLAPIFALKQHAAAEKQMDLDWYAIGIER